jgi:hypothetical protein
MQLLQLQEHLQRKETLLAPEIPLLQQQLLLVMAASTLFVLHILKSTTKLCMISSALTNVNFLYDGIQSKVSTHQI